MRTSAVLAILVLTSLSGLSTATAEAGGEPEPTTLGQALVGFEPAFWPGLAAGDSLRGMEVLDTIPQISVAVVAADDLGEARTALRGLPGVAYVEDDHLLTAKVIPGDPRYGDQYGPGMMGFPAAWGKVGYGSSDVTVAVLDTGIRRTHEDFVGGRVLQGYDYSNNDSNPADDCSHGTHVSGTVGATTDNGKGVAGMSQATILPMKVLSPLGFAFVTCSGSASDIAEAIVDSTDQGADIISMSLGGGGSTTEENAVNYAWNNGVLVVAAAGNDGGSNSVDCPACYDSVIAVAALDASGNRASYSDAGPQVEIAAPGSNVWSTYDSNDASYSSLSGTSMATPHVAGALALALSCDSSLTNVQLRNLMQSTAQDKGAAGRDTVYGYGLLRIDSLVAGLSCGGGGGGNNAPTASFSASTSGLTVSVDGSASSDPDGDALSYSWAFGDGATASGATASHTYASAGTYTVTLTVSDGNGGSDGASQSVSVSSGGGGGGCGSDPEPGVAEMADGSSETVTAPSGGWVYRKVCVPGDATQVQVGMSSSESCGLLGCSTDADLYVRRDAKPTTSAYDCRPYASGSNEQCTVAASGQWVLVGVHGYSGSPTVTLTVDHDGTGTTPTNNPPTASATGSCTDLACSFSGSGSSDPDGDSLSYSWTFGDGATGTGVSPGHTYASAGTYTVTLTVSDGNGGSDTDTVSVTATAPAPAGCGSDPDPGAATMQSGTTYSSAMSAGDWVHRKVCVPAGDTAQVDMSGPACGLLSCSIDADLYVRAGARPTESTWDCRPYLTGNGESCTLTASTTGWYFVGVHAYSGSGTISVVATVS